MGSCSKPGCSNNGAAVLAYDYARRRALIADPPHSVSPHLYVLCVPCADRLTAPRGWVLDDVRAAPPLFVPA